MKRDQGFTLLELLVVIGIIAILAGIVIVALNPARQFAQARNADRENAVTQILNAVQQNRVDNGGIFTCDPDGDGTNNDIPSTPTAIASGTGGAEYNICPCIVPTYIPLLPLDPDPTVGTGANDCTANYDSGYEISQDAQGRVTVSAPAAELGQTISSTL